MDNKKMGKFIAQQRKQLSLTQQSLADRLDITNKAVSKWETGEGYPDISVLSSLAEILEVTVDEILKGEKNDPLTNPGNPYTVKENTEQTQYLLEKSIRHFSNNYLINIGIQCIGIIASSLGLRLYNGFQITTLGYSLMISLSFLIIGILFYNNTCNGFKSDIDRYNRMLEDKGVDLSKLIFKRHILFCAVFLIQAVILICVIPLYHFRGRGYYAVFHRIMGYNTDFRRYLIDYGFCNILSAAVYCILLCVSILIIKKKVRKWRMHQHIDG